MKQYASFFTFLSIILLIIFICTTVSAESGRVSQGLDGGLNEELVGGLGGGKGYGYETYTSSIVVGLLSIKYILGGFIALLGLILLKTVKINQNTRTIQDHKLK